jgi:hypothetical protein
MKARYKPNEPFFEGYNDYLCNYKIDSVFLNPGSSKNQGANVRFWDEANLRNELIQYVGDKKGMLRSNETTRLARIPQAEADLKALEDNFKRYQQRQRNLGFEETTYTSDVLDKKLKLEAIIDVMTGEVEAIEKRLSTFETKKEVVDDSMVLCYGLQGTVKLEGGNPKIIDGQDVGLVADTYCILDERSPYFGMSLKDYNKLCTIWRDEQKKKDRIKLLKVQQQCRLMGVPVVSHLGAKPLVRISKTNLPPYPDWSTRLKRKPTLKRTT